ncbi:hypothetical protein ACVMBY_000764 [Bradyrhizobium huanghuaihaiense]
MRLGADLRSDEDSLPAAASSLRLISTRARLGFGGRDQACGKITLDLRQLILVDRDLTGLILAALILRASTAAERPEHGENRRDRHQREHEP